MLTPESIDISREIKLLKKKMERKQFKITPQRLKLAEWIFRVHEHFTVDDLVESFKNQGEKISIATAYRMIQLMQELNLIIKHDFGRGQHYYEHTPGHSHHDHIICNECNKIVEFFDGKLENLKSNISEEHGFRMTDHSLQIHGDCLDPKCENRPQE